MSMSCWKAVSHINEILRPTSFISNIQSFFDLGTLHDAVNLTISHPVQFHHPPYLKVLQLCIDKKAYNHGRLVHKHLYENGFHSNLYINTKLVIMYSKAGDMKSAHDVFEKMRERSVVSWTALLSGYAQNGSSEKALMVFLRMHQSGFKANQFTYGSALKACTRLLSLGCGMQIQGCIYKSKFVDNLFVQCGLVELHSKCGKMEDACYVFKTMSDKDLVSWNSMIGGFAVQGLSSDAFLMFRLMLHEDITPDNFTLASVLMASARYKDLTSVRQLHVFVLKLGFGSYNCLNGSLINAYTKSGNVKTADQIYKSMIEKDTISCTALITGYAREGSNSTDALKLFIELHRVLINVDGILLCSMINICADTTSLGFGKQIHAISVKYLACHDVAMSNALIDMYSKSGEIIDACQVFDEMNERNVISWTSLIAGYGKHGYGHNAITLYKKMVHEGSEPNDITFLSLLFSCSHCGLTTEGREFFNSMVSNYNILPQAKHYSCMVDLLARGGEIEEAYRLTCNMGVKPNASIWGAILGACCVYGNVVVGEVVARHLFDMEPQNSVNYVVLASIYAAAGLWDCAWNTRKLMERKNLHKHSGMSFVRTTSTTLSLPPPSKAGLLVM